MFVGTAARLMVVSISDLVSKKNAQAGDQARSRLAGGLRPGPPMPAYFSIKSVALTNALKSRRHLSISDALKIGAILVPQKLCHSAPAGNWEFIGRLRLLQPRSVSPENPPEHVMQLEKLA